MNKKSCRAKLVRQLFAIFIRFYCLCSPRKVRINAENRQDNNFAHDYGLERFEKVSLKVVYGNDKTHMRGRQHLARYAEGHRYSRQVQIARIHSGDNGHYYRYVALGHTGQHADDEGYAGDDYRHRQRRVLEGDDYFVENVCDGENLNEVKYAQHVEEHFNVQCAYYHFLQADEALGEAQHEEQACGHDAHTQRSVEIEKDY